MKNFFIYIFFACIFLMPWKTNASETGRVILDIQPEPEKVDEKELTIYRQIEKLLERYRHFEETFPGDAIDGDIYDEVAKVYPYLGYQELEDKIGDIRYTIKMYRKLKNMYEEIREKMLIPEAPPLIVDEKDYDKPYNAPYVESESDQPVIIPDFKKVLSYGINKQDFEAMELRYKMLHQKSEKDKDNFEKMWQLAGEIEWSKLFFYGVVYELSLIHISEPTRP